MSGGQGIISCGTGDPIPGTEGHSTVKAPIPKRRSFWWVKDCEEYQVTMKNNWWHDNGLADRCTEMLADQPPAQGPWLSEKQRQRYDQGPKFTLACKASFYRPENPQTITISRDLLMSFSRLARDMVWNWEATAKSGLYQNEPPSDLEWFQLVSNYYDQPPPPFTVFDPENKFVNPVDDTSVIRHQPQAFWKAVMCFFKYIQNGPPLEIKLDGEITKEFLIRHARAIGSPMFWHEIHVQFPGIVNGYEGGKLVAPDQEEAILRTEKHILRMEAGLPDWEAAGRYTVTFPAETRSTRNRADRKQYNTSYHPLDDEMSSVDEHEDESDYDKMSVDYQTPNDDEMSDGEHISDDEVAGPGRSLPRGRQLLSSRGTYPPGSFLASAPPSLSERPLRKRQRTSTSAATPVQAPVQPSQQSSFAGYGSRQPGTVDNHVVPAAVPPPHRPSPQPSVTEALQQRPTLDP